MKRTTWIIIALTLAPAALAAQVTAQASGAAQARTAPVKADAKVDANAEARFKAPKGWTAEGATKLEAMYADAEKRDVPREPIADRVAEGYAKGASQTTILASVGEFKSRMEATHDAMVSAGRKKPSHEEVERGAMLMERGVTRVQIETMAKRTPSERSLVVAFDVLGQLAARGVPVTQALTRVQAKLDARASDAAIISLVGTGSANPPMAGLNTAGSVTASAGAAGGTVTSNAAGAVTGTSKGIGASATGTVVGIVKRP